MMSGNVFHFMHHITNFVIEGFNVHTIVGIVLTSVGVAALTILYEGLKCWRFYLLEQANKSPLTYGHEEINVNERSPLVRSLAIPASIDHYKSRRISFHVLQSFLHMVQGFLSFLLMLIVMTFNLWLFLSVLLGTAIGYMIFAVYLPSSALEVQQDHIDQHSVDQEHYEFDVADDQSENTINT